MKRLKILVVDNDSYMRELLAQLLSAEYQVLLAKNGQDALAIARDSQPSLILMDVILPGANGIETCRQLRLEKNTASIPVIMLTAVNESSERTKAFQAGADDYVAKPFVPGELFARIQSKLKTSVVASSTVQTPKAFGNIRLDFDELNAEIDGAKVELGPIEFKILNCLMKNQGKLVERKSLADFVWGEAAPERALDAHITALRKKIKSARAEVKTVYGRGYSFVARSTTES